MFAVVAADRTGFTKKPDVVAFSAFDDAFNIILLVGWFDVPAEGPIAILNAPCPERPAFAPIAIEFEP